MNLNYLFEFSLLYACCGIFYLMLYRSSSPKLLRRFILWSLGLSLIIPILPNFASQVEQVVGVLLPEALIVAQVNDQFSQQIMESNTWTAVSLFPYVFILVSLAVAISLSASIYKILKIISQSEQQYRNGRRLIFSKEIQSPCSFFNIILLPKHLSMQESDLELILQHEILHIEYWHSSEKLILEMFQVLLWWHPSHYLFRKQLNLIHEYEVDEAMLHEVEPKSYKDLLLQLIINPPGLRKVNPFSSQIKKRIKMMNKERKKFSTPVLMFCLFGMIASLLLVHACSSDVANEEYGKLVDDEPTVVGFKETISVVDTITTFDADTYEEHIQIVKNEMEVFKTPEVMPVFPGCQEANSAKTQECSQNELLKFVYQNVLYPKVSREAGVEGTVLMKYVINEHGKISYTELLRTPDGALGESVKNVLNKLREEITWIPGQHNGENVNVSFVLPVKFKLEE